MRRTVHKWDRSPRRTSEEQTKLKLPQVSIFLAGQALWFGLYALAKLAHQRGDRLHIVVTLDQLSDDIMAALKDVMDERFGTQS